MERIKRNIWRGLLGVIVGAAAGFGLSLFSQYIGSQCTIMCNPPVAMSYMGFVGLIVAVK